MSATSSATQNAKQPSSIALLFHAATLGTFFAASSAPTPLYRLYQQSFAFSPVLITVIFSVYAFALLLALLIAGSISDHLGRRPVIFGALVVQIGAMGLFIAADSANWLIAARIVQGLATGVAGASIGAALIDTHKVNGPIVNGIGPLVGMAIGALGTAVLVAYGPAPMHFVYVLLLAIILLQALALWMMPETVTPKPGVIASLKPQVVVPPQARRSLLAITPINIAGWMLGGFYLSLIPSLVANTVGNNSPIIGGAMVAALTLSGATTVFLRRTKSASSNLVFGVPSMALGLLTVVAGVHNAAMPLLLIGTLIAGAGFGSNFSGSMGTIMPLAKPDERGGLLAAFYIQSYLAFSLPAILAGFLSKAIGYAATTDIYATAIILLISAGLLALRSSNRRAKA